MLYASLQAGLGHLCCFLATSLHLRDRHPAQHPYPASLSNIHIQLWRGLTPIQNKRTLFVPGWCSVTLDILSGSFFRE
jgi:hypothetical protein